jgi:hypothetical protein
VLRPETLVIDPNRPALSLGPVKRAVCEGWVSPEVGRAIVEEMARIVLDDRASTKRERIQAARVVIAAGMRDAAAERTRVQEQGQDTQRVLDRLRQLLLQPKPPLNTTNQPEPESPSPDQGP